jgi:hypothetical protein
MVEMENDECECGHLRKEHEDLIGRCIAEESPCCGNPNHSKDYCYEMANGCQKFKMKVQTEGTV